MDAFAYALPRPEQLDLFLDVLRRAEFKVGPDQIAEAQDILLLAHTDAQSARRLKTMLAPIVARSATQQTDFYRRFDEFVSRLRIAPRGIRFEKLSNTYEEIGGPWLRLQQVRDLWLRVLPRRIQALMLAGVVAIAVIVVGVRWLSPPPPTPANTPAALATASPPVGDAGFLVPPTETGFNAATLYQRPGYAWALGGLLVAPFVPFGGWMWWRWRRRRLWLQLHPGLGDADPAALSLGETDQPLFPAAQLTAVVPDLRRHRRVPTRDIDVEQTIPTTIAAGGSFTPVWQTIPRSPSYLFLVERESLHDHLAGIVDTAVERLRREGVFLERYYYPGDPCWLMSDGSDGRGRRMLPVADVAARFGDHRLAILGTGDGFFEPLSDRMQQRVEQALMNWEQRSVLSTKPIEAWSWRELALVGDAGFDLATASRSGLRALADRAAIEPSDQGQMLQGVVVSRPARMRQSRIPTPQSTLVVAANLTPVVTIQDPANGSLRFRPELSLTYTVRFPTHDPIERVEARVDGIKVEADDQVLRAADGERVGILRLKAPPREVAVAIIAYNSNGASEAVTIRLPWRGPDDGQMGPKPTRWKTAYLCATTALIVLAVSVPPSGDRSSHSPRLSPPIFIVPGLTPRSAGLYAVRELAAGTLLDDSGAFQYHTGLSVDAPTDFLSQLKGFCLSNSIPKGGQINWSDVAVICK